MATFMVSIDPMKLFQNFRRTGSAALTTARPASTGRNHKPDTMLPGKAEFIRQITHDIKGDFFGVSSVCLMLKLAIEKKDDPMAFLDHLSEACEEYKYKLNNFLEYTKFDAGLYDTIREPVNIRSLLKTAIGETENRATPKSIRFELSVSDNLPRNIVGDEFRLKHITENLLVNAINFSAPGSRIGIAAEKKGTNWTLTISDNGIGMTPEQLGSLFKLTPAERMCLKNPTGLGLLVTRYLVEDVLQGRLSLASEARTGTTIVIELPLAEAITEIE